jgi:ABC-type transport system involved in multi-copper enzyme maturation permease subunit
MKTLLVARREIAAYFLSPVAYLVATLFLLVEGYSFFIFLRVLNQTRTMHGAVLQYFFGGTFLFWLFVMFLAAVITMRLIAEERRAGTLEPLLTAPIAEGSVIVGKFLGALVFYVALWAPTLFYVFMLALYAPPGAGLDPGPLAAGYLGTFLVGASALALGLLFSTFTRNQILAAVLAFVSLTMLLLAGMLASSGPRESLAWLSLFHQMQDFGRGIVDSRVVVYHLGWICVALFAATRALAAGRASSFGWRAVVEVALVAAAVAGVNYLSSRHWARADWTRGRTFALSDKTSGLIRDLSRDVAVIVFMEPTGDYANELYGDVHELTERARRLSPHLHVEYVDIDRDAERAKTVAKQYSISEDDLRDGVIVVAAGTQSKFITRNDLAEYDYAAASQSGGPPPLTAWKGEQALVSALAAVTDERAPNVCFVTGHGEPASDGFTPGDYGDFSEELKRDHQAPRAIRLEHGVPADCDLTIVAGPEQPLPAGDVTELARLLERGGRLMVLLGPTFDARVTRFVDTGLEPLLARWGATVGNDVVVDVPRLRGSAVAFAVTEGYADHAITRHLLHRQTVWSNVRSVAASAAGAKLGIDARALVHTSGDGWGETDLGIFRAEAELKYDPGVDAKGPLPIAVAVERTEGTGKGARLVVFGSSDLASNRVVLGYNRELLLSATAWLEQRAPRIAIGPRTPEQLHLSLDDGQLARVFWVCVIGLPLLALLLGGGVFWVRRS